MEISTLINYMSQYGLIFLFIIVLLEYMNLPGFPAGIIMPLAGIWSHNTGVNFVYALLISVIAGLIGSWILYGIGWLGGELFLENYLKKFPKQQDLISNKLRYLREKGNVGVFISKLLPMVRTLIGIPAGVLKMNFISYSISSTLGIIIWNGVLMGTGFIFGESVLKILS